LHPEESTIPTVFTDKESACAYAIDHLADAVPGSSLLPGQCLAAGRRWKVGANSQTGNGRS
jgi:hypothetical protein